MPPRSTPTPATIDRFSPRAWERYAPIIAAWQRQHPKEYVFKPTAFAVTTTCSRLRDAVKAGLNNGYVHPTIDMAALKTQWSGVIVTPAPDLPDFVRIGPPLKAPTVIESPDQKLIQTEATLEVSNKDQLLAAMCLVSEGVLVGPIRALAELMPVYISHSRPNLAILDNNPDSFTFI